MTSYVAETFGWITVIEADNKQAALKMARNRAETASLERHDVQPSNIREATDEDIAWYEAQAGSRRNP